MKHRNLAANRRQLRGKLAYLFVATLALFTLLGIGGSPWSPVIEAASPGAGNSALRTPPRRDCEPANFDGNVRTRLAAVRAMNYFPTAYAHQTMWEKWDAET